MKKCNRVGCNGWAFSVYPLYFFVSNDNEEYDLQYNLNLAKLL
jgi:hypothetical protein